MEKELSLKLLKICGKKDIFDIILIVFKIKVNFWFFLSFRYEKHTMLNEDNVRSNSASSDSAIYYASSKDRIYACSSSQQQQQQQQPSRPNSSSSQPDYTQVSPAKMALRRHLSQEKLAQQQPSHSSHTTGNGTMMATKTIGDLVNGEIERTLEISHQSIINAAVNMSSVGSGIGGGHERPIINTNIPRPERVNVRILEDSQQPSHHNITVPNSAYSPISRPNSCENLRKTPPTMHLHGGQNNLTNLAHVAYNHKIISQPQTQQQQQQQHISAVAHHAATAAMLVNNNISSTTSRSSSGHISSRSSYPPMNSAAAVIYQSHQSSQQSSSRNSNIMRDTYSNVQLPKAEMKPYLESYFTNEDQKPSSRMMNGNPPLEGMSI